MTTAKRTFLATSLALLLSTATLTATYAQQPPPPPDRGQRGDRPPPPRDNDGQRPRREPGSGAQRYSLEQAMSDKAQLHTIAFDGLAFLTGDFGYDTFLPPGKVSDYFGFQYMRDIDAAEGGHNTNFLTRIANNTLRILDDAQKAKLMALAQAQEADVRRFAQMRFPLIKAFREHLEGRANLSKAAVIAASSELYALDGQIAYDRARVMGEVLRSLTPAQKSALAQLKFGDSRTWPDLPDALDKRRMSHDINVAMMTYASEMFAWYAGSIDADTYFCPERHGMYFGGFGMKTAPAMGKQNYSISTSLTGDAGENFLAILTDSQRREITALPDLQRKALQEIAANRRLTSVELRTFLAGGTPDRAKVIAQSRRYGELDGELSYLYATVFAKVGRTLSNTQRQQLASLRQSNPSDPRGPFLYSTPTAMPQIESTDRFFTK